jgi:predicted  nucleic acid-binding Zn-ribbon protein
LSPNGQDSSSQGLLSRLWSWINSYGGLSDLRKYNAELRKYNAEMKKYNAETRKFDSEMKKLDEEKRIQHEQRMNDLRQQNARLAELELKLDIVLQSSDSNLIPTISTDDN